MNNLPDNQTRDRILATADALFSERGYAAVTLRDIATAVGMRHASLYYYAPGGKEQLFVEVMERNLRQHHEGISRALAEAGDDLAVQLVAVAHWLLAQPLLDLNRMAHADLQAVRPERAEHLARLAYALHEPLIAALDVARARGAIRFADSALAALSFVTLVQGLHAVPERYRNQSHERVVEQLVAMLLEGLRHTP
ncbi:MAG: TetR/AcrR family transcriptional regulator [Chloroflexaceae bacterium]|jgi:AcrR family transcriptional regulator|nr:TetR/AcrR family transcriptional regulator [Chloroflexaceae bacterium]